MDSPVWKEEQVVSLRAINKLDIAGYRRSEFKTSWTVASLN